MNIIKRDGREAVFDRARIIKAVSGANEETKREYPQAEALSAAQMEVIAEQVEAAVAKMSRAPNVEEIQSLVIAAIDRQQAYTVAQLYTEYKFRRELARHKNTTDDAIFSLVEHQNEEIKQENSNKDPMIAPTQRDYIAGEVSKDLTMRVLLPNDVVEEHKRGGAHFHDADYFIQKIHNCDLINLEDMLQNGTVISGVQITKPRSLLTAANLTCQIITQVASSQYGGQTFTLSHLAPFVDISRKKIREEVVENLEFALDGSHWGEGSWEKIPEGLQDFYADKDFLLSHCSVESIEKIVEKRLEKEIRAAIQTIQYQLVTMMTTNGQTPFVSMFLCLREVEGRTRDDLALLAKEVLTQRIKGLPNEQGHWVTAAFPKLLYAMDEDNAYAGSEYFGLTELAAQCIAKQMVPDIISVKKMLELKGDVYPCMGCVDGKSIIGYELEGKRYASTFESAWEHLASRFEVKLQANGTDCYMDTPGVKVYDSQAGKYVSQRRIIRNVQSSWRHVEFSGSRGIDATADHPFEVIREGVVKAEDLKPGSSMYCVGEAPGETCTVMSVTPYEETKYSYDVTTETEHFTVNGIYSHNCRSFLTPDRFTDAGAGNIANAKNYKPMEHKYYGRFNQGVYTLNLVDIACLSGRDMDKFWEIFDQKLEIAHKALRCRHERLKGTCSDVSPILWQHGALARLKPGETIDRLLYKGYSTISLGYAGLYECCMYMTGRSHTDEAAKPFALKVMQHMNDACAHWKAEEDIDYSLYGTPLESTTYKFATALQKQYGCIKDVTDHNYITNSYHVNVREEIDAFTKLSFEAEFQALSPGGAISYVEVPDLTGNIPAVIALMQYIYENIMYAELNTKSDYCQACGYEGEIKIVGDMGGKLVWECPNCRNRDQGKMDVARRTCGYIGTQFWNQGRTQEIRDRVLHL